MKALATINTHSLDQLGATGRVVISGIGGFLAADPVMEVVNTKVRGIDHTPLGITGKLVGAGVTVAVVELVLRKGGGVDLDVAKKHLLRDAAEYATKLKALPDGEEKNKKTTEFSIAFNGRTVDDVIEAAKVAKAA